MLLRIIRPHVCLKKVIDSNMGFKNGCFYQRSIRMLCNSVHRDNHERLDKQLQENEFWYKMLVNDKRYSNHVALLDYLENIDGIIDLNMILNNNFASRNGYLLTKYLKNVLRSNTSVIRSESVTELTKQLQCKLKDLSDEQLINLLKILNIWPDKGTDQRFFDLCKAIDVEALERSRAWGYNTILLVMDHFYQLQVMRYSDFLWQNMKRLWRNPGKLSPQQIVHAMFLVNANRKWHQAVNMADVETVLMHYMYDLTVEEAGLLALAFFKTKTPAHDLNLINILYDKFEQRLEDRSRPLESMIISAYLKFFRLATVFSMRHRIQRLLEKLTHYIGNMALNSCTHAALLGTRLVVRNEEVLQKVAEQFYEKLSSARLKDLERLTFAFELFNFTPKTERNIFEAIMEELHKRDREISSFPKVFLYTLNYLSLKGYYDYELINRGLSIDFLKNTFGNINPHALPRDILQLSAGVHLECPDYMGSRLGDCLVRQMSELHSRSILTKKKELTNSERTILSASNMLEKILGGQQFVRVTYTLPYSPREDIMCCLRDGKPVEIPTSLPKNYMKIQKPPDIGDWLVIYRLGVGVTIADTTEPVGSLLAKIRHLKILGYKPLALHENDWLNLNTDKEKYMRTLIESAK